MKKENYFFLQKYKFNFLAFMKFEEKISVKEPCALSEQLTKLNHQRITKMPKAQEVSFEHEKTHSQQLHHQQQHVLKDFTLLLKIHIQNIPTVQENLHP